MKFFFDLRQRMQIKWYTWKLRRQIKEAHKGREKYAESIRRAGWRALDHMDFFYDAGPRLRYWTGALEIEDAVHKADLEASGRKEGTILFQWDQ